MQLVVLGKDSSQVSFNISGCRHPLALRELVVHIIDSLGLAVGKVRPDDVPHARRHTFPEELPHLMTFSVCELLDIIGNIILPEVNLTDTDDITFPPRSEHIT